VDEVFIRINGTIHYLWRAVDQNGQVVDILVRGYQTFCVNGVFRKDKENANGREEQIGCSAG
jgi:putative transposase